MEESTEDGGSEANVPKAKDRRCTLVNDEKLFRNILLPERESTAGQHEFKLRIVYIDYYVGEKVYWENSRAKNSLRNTSITCSPIIRIFGRTPAGQSACLHIHEYYPYIFVLVPQEVVSGKVDKARFLAQLKGLKTLNGLKDAFYVSGTPFYGYHQDERLFVKLEFLDPDRIRQNAAALLSERFQPFESHISYLMHFMSDYNLFGMNFIKVNNFTFRYPLPKTCSCPHTDACNHRDLGTSYKKSYEDADSMYWVMENTPSRLIVRPKIETPYMAEQFLDYKASVPYPDRQCPDSCDIECDAPAFSILNHRSKRQDYSCSASAGTQGRVIPSLESWWHHLSQFLHGTQVKSLSPSQDRSESFYTDMCSEMYSQFLKEWLDPNEVKVSQKYDIEAIKNSVGIEYTSKKQSRESGNENTGNLDDTKEQDSQVLSQFVASQEVQGILDDWQENLINEDENVRSSQSYFTQTPTPLDDVNVPSELGDGYVSNEEISDEEEQDENDYDPDDKQILETWQGISESQADNAFNYGDVEDFEMSEYETDSNIGDKLIPQVDGIDDDDDTNSSINSGQKYVWNHEDSTQLDTPENSQSDTFGLIPKEKAPNIESLVTSLNPQICYEHPFFSKPIDEEVNKKSEYIRKTESIRNSDPFYVRPRTKLKRKAGETWPTCLEPISRPPCPAEVYQRFKREAKTHSQLTTTSSIADSSIDKKGSMKLDSTMLETRVMCIEVLSRSVCGNHSDPRKDPVLCVCFVVFGAGIENPIEEFYMLNGTEEKRDELQLFRHVVQTFNKYDPDIIMSYELQKHSLGYLFKRAETLGLASFSRELSRASLGPQDRRHCNDVYGEKNHTDFWLVGRIILNCWRIVRKEVNLTMYSLEHVCYELLKKKLPKYECRYMQGWYDGQEKFRIPQHLFRRAKTTISLMDHLDIVVRTSEIARFIGADFFSVLTRGSQFHVESVMVRIGRARNYLMPSPSKEQVAKQPALDEIALTLEPRTRLYNDPVVVLDFRSLYPSIIIAYNLCYSTFVGKLTTEKYPFKPRLGIYSDFVPETKDRILKMYRNNELFVAPNGALFIKASVRRGILPMMLEEILETRIRVKAAMKCTKKGKKHVATRVLDARQYALKMIANVTYGYTSASFSGRMPCADLADTIVRLARASLEDCIRKINLKGNMSQSPRSTTTIEKSQNGKAQNDSFSVSWTPHSLVESKSWSGANVVYGDTDSVFVHLPGTTLLEAFAIGRDIALKLSVNHPQPMKLQFEKVYLPCMLIAKKRYCGAIFESESEAEHYLKRQRSLKERNSHNDMKLKLEAKGIEIVRRDSCPLVGHMMEELLNILFVTKDLSLVRSRFDKYIFDIMSNRIPIREFVVSSQVKLWVNESYGLVSGYRSAYPTPSAAVAKRRFRIDPMNYPLYKERVPYVITKGLPTMRLLDMACEPKFDSRINAVYYIERKIIPPLSRLFHLVGVDIESWWKNKTKIPSSDRTPFPKVVSEPGLIDHFMCKSTCYLCRKKAKNNICTSCSEDKQRQHYISSLKKKMVEERAFKLNNICRKLCDAEIGDKCVSTDCEIYYQRSMAMFYAENLDW